MSSPPTRTFAADFKRSTLRGLAVLLPTVLTLWLIVYAYRFVDGFIAAPINAGIRSGIALSADRVELLRAEFDPAPEAIQSELAGRRGRAATASPESVRHELRLRNIEAWWEARWWTDLIGLVVAILIVYSAGRLVGGFVGRSIYARLERLVSSLPIIRAVYPSVKQVVDFLISDEKQIRFSRVVVVEYPRKGIWSIGLVTADGVRTVGPDGCETITLFVPSSPTPFTGYTITVPRDEVRELPISIDQALRFVVSGGVLTPDLPQEPGAPRIVAPPSPEAVAAPRARRDPAAGAGSGVP